MGVISILLGLIAFFGFTAAGAITASYIEKTLTRLSTSLTVLQNTATTTISAVTIGVFAFIGLLICVNLVMHGLIYMNKTRYNSSVSYICFALGLISILCLIMAGLYVARNVVNNRNMLMLLGVLPDIPEALLFWGVVGVFTFLGVLIFVDFLMHGLTYKKVGKLQVRIRRKGE